MEPPEIPLRASSKRSLDLETSFIQNKRDGKKLKKSMESIDRLVDPISCWQTKVNIVEIQEELLCLRFKDNIAFLEDQKLPKGSEEWLATYNNYVKIKAALGDVRITYERQIQEYSARYVQQAIDGTNMGAGPVGEMLVELLMDAYSRQNLQGSSRKGAEQSQIGHDVEITTAAFGSRLLDDQDGEKEEMKKQAAEAVNQIMMAE